MSQFKKLNGASQLLEHSLTVITEYDSFNQIKEQTGVRPVSIPGVLTHLALNQAIGSDLGKSWIVKKKPPLCVLTKNTFFDIKNSKYL